VDFTSVFFKAWQGALWLLGDREEERAITEAENKRKTENAEASDDGSSVTLLVLLYYYRMNGIVHCMHHFLAAS